MLRAINSLTFEAGPLPCNVEGPDSWICLYKDGSGHAAATITPVIPYLHSWISHH
ncbi:hypothetical protein ACNVED_16200 (plasmid) [Legionella sp. D16C41]|uniref:hypothetical protein n=1 Tax=Legionella sp. D16C41 TaxID=3402688 RepID=UPI003AF900E3